MSTILERLIMLQEQSGMNQKQLQKELGLSNSAFSDWKKGKGRPSVEALVRFSEFFGVSMDWLAFGNVETSGNHLKYFCTALLSIFPHLYCRCTFYL